MLNISDGKEIIKANSYRHPKVITLIIVGILLVVLSIGVASFIWEGGDGVGRNGKYYYWVYGVDNFVGFFFGEFFVRIYGIFCLLGVACAVIGIILLLLFKDNSIIVTDNGVYGVTSFGRKIKILISQISAVEKTVFDGIVISAGSNRYKFWCIDNREMVFSTISELLYKF